MSTPKQQKKVSGWTWIPQRYRPANPKKPFPCESNHDTRKGQRTANSNRRARIRGVVDGRVPRIEISCDRHRSGPGQDRAHWTGKGPLPRDGSSTTSGRAYSEWKTRMHDEP